LTEVQHKQYNNKTLSKLSVLGCRETRVRPQVVLQSRRQGDSSDNILILHHLK